MNSIKKENIQSVKFVVKRNERKRFMSDFDLGQLIKEHLKAAGLTQLKLADLAGIGKTTVFDIEKNKKSIRWNSLMAVLNVLNIDIQFISPLKK